MIDVLWLAKGLGPGGMERLLETHARIGDREQFRYHAAYLVERPNSVVPSLEAAGVTCTRLGNGRDLDLRWAAELRALVRREGIDVVHVHSPMAAAVARPALRAMRRRPGVVYTEHNSWDCYGRATRYANAATLPLDDARVAVSVAAAESAPAPLARHTEVLTHGIDRDAVVVAAADREAARTELGAGPADVVVITVANLRHEKGYDVLLDAATRAAAADPRLRFVAVGQGPLADDLAAAHAATPLGDRFRFLGFRPDVHRLLGAADVFLLASRQEGLPVALMEATALGLPIVSTRVGGIPDVLDDRRSALLVPSEDPAALAAAVVEVAADPSLAAVLAEGSRAASAQFDAGVAVARLEQIYRRAAR